jgi:hypothetical protein
MKRLVLLVAGLFLVACVSLAALALAVPPEERDLVRVGPITSWKWHPDGDPSHSLFGATAFVCTPLAKFLPILSSAGWFHLGLDVEVFNADGERVGHAFATGPIQLAEAAYPQLPDGFLSVGRVDAAWD